jgi:hypothetical protein
VSSEDSTGAGGERQTEQFGFRDGRGRADVRYRRERSSRGEGAERRGDEFRDLDATLRWGRPGNGLSLRTRVNWRRRWSLDGARTNRLSDGLTTELETEWVRAAALRLGALLIRRDLDSYTEIPDRTTYMGRLHLSQTAWNGAWTTQWRSEATSQAVRVRNQLITFVGEGQGHYDALGRYVGVGDYEVYYEDTGSDELQSVLDLTGRWSAAPGKRHRDRRAAIGSPWIDQSEWSFFLRTRVESPEALTTILGDPGRWWGRHGAASSGSGNIRTDLRLLNRTPAFSPTIRWEGNSRSARSRNGIAEESRSTTWQLSATSTPQERVRLEVKQIWTDEDRRTSLEAPEGLSDTARLTKRRSEATVVYRLIRILRIRLQAAGEREREAGASKRELWELTPGVVLNFRGGRAELRARRLWAAGDKVTSRIFNLDRPGWTIRSTADLRLQRYIDLSFWLEGRRPDAGTNIVSSRVSVRAIF